MQIEIGLLAPGSDWLAPCLDWHMFSYLHFLFLPSVNMIMLLFHSLFCFRLFLVFFSSSHPSLHALKLRFRFEVFSSSLVSGFVGFIHSRFCFLNLFFRGEGKGLHLSESLGVIFTKVAQWRNEVNEERWKWMHQHFTRKRGGGAEHSSGGMGRQ